MTRNSEKARPTIEALLPDDAPVLTASDICRYYAKRDGSRDLAAWLSDTFDTDPSAARTPAYDAAYAALCGVLGDRLGRPVPILWLFLEGVAKADTPDPSWQAACWNEALSRLGYAVPRAARRDPGLTR